ncbi:lipid-A-disaccharide synthase N-terminal domain-containing protein [Shivajiella indica]|uniref:Lipid-A-disaccharide synthase N-terminal domain-containing protein n=1 Tax=Shivajiella indica TaxID=872115 RepID=A0ABW5BG04_9BACT
MSNFLILGLGLFAQGLFAARFIVQLLKSEKENKVVSPALFWQLSLIASFLLILYGFFRNDIVIVGGQLVGYLIYIRNLQIKGEWKILPLFIRSSAYLLPALLLLFLVFGLDYNWEKLMDNPEIESLLLTWGTIGQVIFTSRFVIQWLYSERINESAFPVSFWYISIVGAIIISVYAIFRKDAVLFIGQSFGLIVYFRNLYLNYQFSFRKSMSLFVKFKPYRFQAVMIFTAMVLFFNLGSWGVTESSEARYAQIPKEMLESGDYLHPTLMGIYHYHKPPITYWITAASYKIFGISAWSARVFLQISILLQIWLVYKLWGLIFGDKDSAFYASMLYASFPTVIISGRALTTDGYLALFILTGIYCWFLYIKKEKRRYLLLFYLMLGLGFLTKGPVVLIVAVVLLISQKIFLKLKSGNGWFHLTGILLFLGIGLSWFVFLFIEDRQFLDYFLFKHTVERFASDTFKRSQPFWFYIPIVIGTAFPWILIIAFQAKKVWNEKNKNLLPFLIWVFVPLIFFSISKSKLVLYILPVYPGIALAAAAIWLGLKAETQKKWDRVLFYFHLLILIGLAISPLIDPKIVLNYKFYFILIVTASVLISVRAIPMKVRDRTVFNAYIFIMGITAASTYFFTNNAGLANDQKNIAEFIQKELPQKENIIVYDKRLPSMSFLTDKNIISLYDGSEDLNRETQFEKNENWKKNLINLKEEQDWLLEKLPPSSVLMVKKSRLTKGTVAFPKEDFKNQTEMDGWVLFY